MKPIFLIVTAALSPALMAQEPGPTPPRPSVEEAVAAFSVKPPDESSVFFSDREMARMERRAVDEGEVFSATGPNNTAIYPKVRGTESSATAIFTGFFTDMFSSIRLGKSAGSTPSDLKVEPEDFSLSDRREVDVTYVIRNNGRKILRIDYPSTQRIEILTKDPAGAVVDRWSDDRAFQDSEGIVFINPGERIQYSERVPTREMKAGETYTITGEVPANPGYEATTQIVPDP